MSKACIILPYVIIQAEEAAEEEAVEATMATAGTQIQRRETTVFKYDYEW